jgi:Protein of unknown function (DUF3040)
MPLSENEQRMLAEIERALVEDDPKFASTVRSTNPRSYLLRRVRRSALVFLLGLIALVVGVALKQTPLIITFGVLGFALMLFAALRAASALRRLSGRGGPDQGTRHAGRRGGPKRRTRPSLSERMEERWRRRWEDSGD